MVFFVAVRAGASSMSCPQHVGSEGGQSLSRFHHRCNSHPVMTILTDRPEKKSSKVNTQDLERWRRRHVHVCRRHPRTYTRRVSHKTFPRILNIPVVIAPGIGKVCRRFEQKILLCLPRCMFESSINTRKLLCNCPCPGS